MHGAGAVCFRFRLGAFSARRTHTSRKHRINAVLGKKQNAVDGLVKRQRLAHLSKTVTKNFPVRFSFGWENRTLTPGAILPVGKNERAWPVAVSTSPFPLSPDSALSLSGHAHYGAWYAGPRSSFRRTATTSFGSL